VEELLRSVGVEDVPDVVLLEPAKQSQMLKLRKEGTIALRKDVIIPPSEAKHTTDAERQRQKLAEKKAIAIVQLLHGWGLLEKMNYEAQENLIKGILQIVLLEN